MPNPPEFYPPLWEGHRLGQFSQYSNASSPQKLLQIILLSIVNRIQGNSAFIRLLRQTAPKRSDDWSATQPDAIPVKRLRHPSQVVYLSALPQILVGSDLAQRQAIAAALHTQFLDIQTGAAFANLPPGIPPEALTGWISALTPQGALMFTLQNSAIAHWLNQLLHVPLPLLAIAPPPLPQLDQRVFVVQHAHARCCTLLKQAQQTFATPPLPSDPSELHQLTHPAMGQPWELSPHQVDTSSESERSLAHQLLQALDQVNSPLSHPAKQLLITAEAISSAFHQHYRQYQLFATNQNQERYQSHLSMLLLTRNVLCQLLKSLSYIAPTEL